MKLAAVWRPALQLWRPSGSHIARNAKPLSWFSLFCWKEESWCWSFNLLPSTCWGKALSPEDFKRVYGSAIFEQLARRLLAKRFHHNFADGASAAFCEHFYHAALLFNFFPLHAAGVVGRVPWWRLGNRAGLPRQPGAIHCPCHAPGLNCWVWLDMCFLNCSPLLILN